MRLLLLCLGGAAENVQLVGLESNPAPLALLRINPRQRQAARSRREKRERGARIAGVKSALDVAIAGQAASRAQEPSANAVQKRRR